MVDVRRYLKSDEGMIPVIAERMKENDAKVEPIHYITQSNGFTLMDLVSYDIKHNESNGENNQDGTEYNYSWNCGFEGKTRKKIVQDLRKKQMKNALLMLFISQGTPMLLAGDEVANSQDGNNNAYCQDNEIGWIQWKTGVVGKEILEFTKQLIQFRKEHPIFHQKRTLMGMDTISCGIPDVSFHGCKAWSPDYSNYSRILGILYCGKYIRTSKTQLLTNVEERSFESDFYVVFNMHWEKHHFDLPILPEHMEWRLCITSADSQGAQSIQKKKNNTWFMSPRTIAIFESVINEEKDKTK